MRFLAVWLNLKLALAEDPAINKENRQKLQEYLLDKPLAYQDEMAWFLFDECLLVCSQSTISKTLKELKYSKTKAYLIAAQRSEELRDDWQRRLAGWRPDQLVFLDESAACERTSKHDLGGVI